MWFFDSLMIILPWGAIDFAKYEPNARENARNAVALDRAIKIDSGLIFLLPYPSEEVQQNQTAVASPSGEDWDGFIFMGTDKARE